MLFQELSKLKRSSIMTSIILMAVGILMIICPPQYIDTLVSALGYGMVTLAAVMVMDFLSSALEASASSEPGCLRGGRSSRTGGCWLCSPGS